MFQALAKATRWFLREVDWSLHRGAPPAQPHAIPAAPAPRSFRPLRRVLLTDGVSRTLFDEYAEHRAGSRGAEETGWLLLCHRTEDEAVALATLPAGTRRHAGVAHVQFHAPGQLLGSRIVRQADRRLTNLGVVHTHPGSLRHPSDGDFRGDSAWVPQLRGAEGVFGIGTADSDRNGDGQVGRQPKPNVQLFGDLRMSWYSLRQGERNYRPLPVELVLGPDLARPLHSIWPVLEAHAEQLERLATQQARVRFDLVTGKAGPALAVQIPLAEPESAVRVVVEGDDVRYLLVRGNEVFEAETREHRIDRAVYLMLAKLAAQS